MKKAIFTMALALGLITGSAQSVSDFESFTLSPNSAYSSTASVPFQTSNAVFPYQWDTQFNYWAGGIAYTNKYDSINTGTANIFGVRAYKGYNGSGMFAVAQDRARIIMKAPYNQLDGFYITNTTYAWKAIKKGDMFARKFGDTTGTKTGTLYAQGSYPDYFKVTVKGYLGGVMKNDSSVFYLADYRFLNNNLDYVEGSWQWLNTSNLGVVDSVRFFMYSSDAGQFGINTPLYFAIDNVSTSTIAGIHENDLSSVFQVYPNPFTSVVTLNDTGTEKMEIHIYDVSGKVVFSAECRQKTLDLHQLEKGIYFMEAKTAGGRAVKKLVKE
jgi:hypothetical protein